MCSAALEDIKKTAYDTVNTGLEPQPNDGWTPAQYATAVRSILAAPANAVSAGALKAQFGGGSAGKQVLQAMVRANLLAYRPRSVWARDIPRSTFGKDLVVITAPTPADLAYMRELDLPEPAPSAGTVSCAALHICIVQLACHTHQAGLWCLHTCVAWRWWFPSRW